MDSIIVRISQKSECNHQNYPKFYFKYIRSSTNIINSNYLSHSICRVYLTKKPRCIIAEVRHFENGPVITASSIEWALKKQLYRYRDLLESRSSVVSSQLVTPINI